MRVILDRDKSLRDPKLDIAVLRLADVVMVTDFLPLGVITETQRGDEILAVGYPAGTLSFISGEIHGFPPEFPQQFFTNAMKAKGQSGGVVYHPTLRRVVGIALELYHQEVVANCGLAGRFDVLFQQWQELGTLNQQAIDRWEERLNVPLPERTHQPTIMQQVDVTNHYGIPPEVFAKYAADLGVTDAALVNFFKILEQDKVDRLDLDKKLREIAESYKKLLENAKLLEGSDDPEVNQLLRQAREFTEGKDIRGNSVTIDFDEADVLLGRALELEQQGIVQLHEIEEKAKGIKREKTIVCRSNSETTQ